MSIILIPPSVTTTEAAPPEVESINKKMFFKLTQVEDGSNIQAFLRKSKRALKPEEIEKITNLPAAFEKIDTNRWRTNFFPVKAQDYLEAAGFKVVENA